MDNGIKVTTIRGNDGGIIKFESHIALESTADIARKHAANGYPDRYAIFSDKRVYPSGDIEDGLYMSVLLRPSIFPSQAPLLGALSATAMVTALAEHTSVPLGLGWVSDLYASGVRIGEATIEGKLDNFTSYEYIIITFSIKITEKVFPPRLNNMIKEVFEEDNGSSSMIMAKDLLKRFFSFYVNLKNGAKFMDTYSEKFILRGQKVKYYDGQRKRSLRVLSVDAKNGALILEGPGGKPLRVFSPSNIQIPKKIKLKNKA